MAAIDASSSPTVPMIEIVKAIAEQWNGSLVNYAVANGLEGYPQRMGRDIDVVVERRHLRTACEVVWAVLEQRGMRVVVRKRAELVQHIGIGPRGSGSLVIDLFPGLRWGPVWLVERPDPTQDNNGFHVDPWVSFVKRVLLHVLVAPRPKFSAHPDRLQLSEAERSAAAVRLPDLLGWELTARLLATMRQQDVGGLERLRPHLRRALVISSVRKAPLRTFRTAVQWAATRLAIATTPPAMPTVSIVGPEGVGKTMVILEVVRQARERLRCSRIAVRDSRPHTLSQLWRSAPTSSSAPVPPRAATWRRLVRTMYYAVDFLLGHLVLDRRISADLGLVVYERGPLDMYVSPARHGLVSGWFARLVMRVMPRADLVVLLHDEPNRIRARTPDLAESELRRQLDMWMQLANKGAVQMVLRVDRDPTALAECIVDRLADLFVRKHLGARTGHQAPNTWIR